MLALRDIHQNFGDLEVLKGVDLTVERGDVLSLIGPSGTGKTTLLRCINFLERPCRGEIRFDGLAVDYAHAHRKDIHAIRRRTAMVFQQFNLFSHRTVLENVMEGPWVVQRLPKAEAADRARKRLEEVGLADKVDAYPAELSGGQQQRAGIARALAMEPEIILFDEPTSSLDPEMVGEVLAVLRKVSRSGITMLVVTHEMEFARQVSNRVVFMDGGTIVEQGPPQEVLLRPQEERTRQFLARYNSSFAYSI